jgi:Amino acid permease
VGAVYLVLTAGAIWLTARGVKLSTAAVGAAVLVKVAIMVAVCFLVLVDQRSRLSGIPFSWAHLTGGLAGLSAGFPLALFMFIGWENGLALAEESRDPRRIVPRALYISVGVRHHGGFGLGPLPAHDVAGGKASCGHLAGPRFVAQYGDLVSRGCEMDPVNGSDHADADYEHFHDGLPGLTDGAQDLEYDVRAAAAAARAEGHVLQMHPERHPRTTGC